MTDGDRAEALRERVALAIWNTTMRDEMTADDWCKALALEDREFYRQQADAAIAVCAVVDDQRREQVAERILRHWPTPTSGCHCGGVPLGHSWPRHLADELLSLLGGPS